jgi:hypothetical protein
VQIARPEFQLCAFEQTRDHEIATVLRDLPAFRGVEAEGARYAVLTPAAFSRPNSSTAASRILNF